MLFLTFSHIFSMSIVFCSFTMMQLGVDFLVFIFLGVLWTSWIYGSWPILCQIFLLLCSLLIFSFTQMLHLWILSHCSLILSLHFILWSFIVLSSSSLILSLVTSSRPMSPSRAFFIVTVSFFSLAPPWILS